MTIHFAPAKTKRHGDYCPSVRRALSRVKLGIVANDNNRTYRRARPAPPPAPDILEAALRHFGQYGLGAARAARMRAKQAFFEGDREAYDWWIGITQALDRRMAEDSLHLSKKTEHAANSETDPHAFAPKNAS
ncbi:MAG: hypothetical protein AAGK17_01675 [Pseudomonadota bacterium]